MLLDAFSAADAVFHFRLLIIAAAADYFDAADAAIDAARGIRHHALMPMPPPCFLRLLMLTRCHAAFFRYFSLRFLRRLFSAFIFLRAMMIAAA